MCFSATASFSAGAVLLGLGTVTLRSARRPRELMFAAIPLLFAVQQMTEGVIWLTFRDDAPQINRVMTQLYAFFSHVLWPAWIPLAVLLMEAPGGRHRVLLTFVAPFFCSRGDDLLPAGHHGQPIGVHARLGESFRCFGAAIVWRGLLFLYDLVHLGVVLFCSGLEQHHRASLCNAPCQTRRQV